MSATVHSDKTEVNLGNISNAPEVFECRGGDGGRNMTGSSRDLSDDL